MQSSPNFPLQSLIGLAMQLALTHLVTALVALWLADSGGLAILVAVVAGLVLTTPLLRTVWLIASAIDRLGQSMTATPLPLRWHLMLAGLPAHLNRVIERGNDVTALHGELVHRTSEAAAQQERNRLGRDLHDSIKQQLFSISMSAAAAEARWEHDPTSARQALTDVRQSAREALVEMTALLQQLSPAPLEKVGLLQALRDQCEALGYRSGADVTLDVGPLPDDERLPHGTQESLFRIVQEALSNIARHARATQVQLDLRQAGETLRLEVQDDGQGFDQSSIHQGMGLTNIRQRVAALEGTLVLESTPGNGARLVVEVPLLEPFFIQEDTMEIKADHTLNRTFLTGAGGGLLLIAALYYPLYIHWPGRYIESWTQGSPAISLALIVVAALLTLATGYAATRWTGVGGRGAGALLGALAGYVATSMAYIVLGSPAAGVAGSAEVLAYGFRPALNETHFLWLIAEAVLDTIYWTYGAMWVMQLAGIGLGALGGLLAAPPITTSSGPELRHTLLSVAWMAVAIYGFAFLAAQFFAVPLDNQFAGRGFQGPLIERVAPYSLSLPTIGVYLIPVGTALFLLLLSMIVVALLQRKQGLDIPRLGWGLALFLYYALFQVIGAISAWRSPSASPLHLGLTTLAAIVCAIFVGVFFRQYHQWRRNEALAIPWDLLILIVCLLLLPNNPLIALPLAGARLLYRLLWERPRLSISPERARYEWQNALNTLGIGFPLAMLLMSQGFPVAVNFINLPVRSITALSAYEASRYSEGLEVAHQAMGLSGPEVVQDLYSIHAQLLLGTLLVIFVAEVLLLLALQLIQQLARRVSHGTLSVDAG